MNKILVFLLFFFSVYSEVLKEKPITVIIPSYNNIRWYKKNLSSIFQQRYSNYRVVYIDDCSEDGTYAAVCQWVTTKRQKHRTTIIRNPERRGAMANWYHAIHETHDDDIIVNLDGDDWLYHRNVFQELNELYTKKDIWYTHGRFIEYASRITHWSEPLPTTAIKNHSYRQFKCPSHLRTYYSWLFKQIDKKYFLYQGEFLPTTCDLAIMFAIAELAAERHAYVEKINYVYNPSNPINDNKIHKNLQKELELFIRKASPLKRLNKRPSSEQTQ